LLWALHIVIKQQFFYIYIHYMASIVSGLSANSFFGRSAPLTNNFYGKNRLLLAEFIC